MDENKGEIYIITSPCGKQYIGQTRCLAKRKDKYIKWGTNQRWRAHINESNSKKKEGCAKLNSCIKKYNSDNFIVYVLLVCDISDLDYFETRMIKEYHTLSPNGLNLKTGGNTIIFSDETRMKMSNSAKGRTFSEETIEKIRIGNTGKIVTDETRAKLRLVCPHPQTIEARQKISDFQKSYLQPKRKYFGLPDYIYFINYPNKKGYKVNNHPTIASKYFVSGKLSLYEKLELAKQYLQR